MLKTIHFNIESKDVNNKSCFLFVSDENSILMWMKKCPQTVYCSTDKFFSKTDENASSSPQKKIKFTIFQWPSISICQAFLNGKRLNCEC